MAGFVAHQGMDINGVERNLVHELQTHHHHPGNPEKDDVKAGNQHIGRIITLKLWGFVGPAESRERPKRRRKPGIQNVRVTDYFDRLAIGLIGLGLSLFLGFGDKNIALVDLEEGGRLMSRVVDMDTAEVKIGMAVQAFIGEIDGTKLILFRQA